MKSTRKRDKICIARAGFTCIETVSKVMPDPERGAGSRKIEITTAGHYAVGERYTIERLANKSLEVIVESVHPVANRDCVRVVFATAPNRIQSPCRSARRLA
jgi:hypothetical protein